MAEDYKWTNKQMPPATRDKGFSNGIGKNDATRQMERLRADNADHVKSIQALQEQVRNLMEALTPKKKSDKPETGKKSDKPEAGDAAGS